MLGVKLILNYLFVLIRLKRPAYETEMHEMIKHANVLNSSAVVYPCGEKEKLEDQGIISGGLLSGIKVRIKYLYISG